MNATEREIAADVTLNGRLLLAQEKVVFDQLRPVGTAGDERLKP